MEVQAFNWFLILIAVIIFLLCLAGNVYVLIHYQHPDDRNQAWIPKIVVVLGLTLAMCTVLMFPLDVANRRACSENVVESACRLTLPMEKLWFAVFIINLCLVWAIIPFTVFFYEGDSDYTCWMKIKNAALWTLMTFVVLGLIIGVAYGLNGYVVYPTQQLNSGLAPLSLIGNITGNARTICIKPGQYLLDSDASLIKDMLCDANGSAVTFAWWELRVSLPVYIMAVQSVLGWILFMVFAGVGVFCAPVDWIFQYLGRPKTIITKSEYIGRARGLAQRAKEIKDMAALLKKQDRDGGRDRRWRGNFRKLQRELQVLEEDEYQLDRVFPQGADGDVKWVTYQLGFILLLIMGVIGMCVSIMWILHVILYMLPVYPISNLLNEMFIKLDSVFALFGVGAFAAFCGYLMVVAIKGNFMLGLNLIVVNLYPMRVGATMMNSMLVNTALILMMSCAVIQFCAQAFADYASATAIFDIFGNQVMYLKGIQYIYNFNIFLYIFLIMAVLSVIFMIVRGPKQWKRKKVEDAYNYS